MHGRLTPRGVVGGWQYPCYDRGSVTKFFESTFSFPRHYRIRDAGRQTVESHQPHNFAKRVIVKSAAPRFPQANCALGDLNSSLSQNIFRLPSKFMRRYRALQRRSLAPPKVTMFICAIRQTGANSVIQAKRRAIAQRISQRVPAASG